ncbi:MAG: PTS sugar transporter subunit IIA [Veillonella parvula]
MSSETSKLQQIVKFWPIWQVNFIKKGYGQRGVHPLIQDREKEYPTGLPSTPPGIAIPHANYEMVNKTTLAIATLKEPALFHNMERQQSSITNSDRDYDGNW